MRGFVILCLIMLAGVAGCAAEHPRQARMHAPRFYVPTAVIVGDPTGGPVAQSSDILPGSDGDYDIPRGEKVVYGATSLGEGSYYSIYTYDAQQISIPHTGGSGYRYRYIVQQGTSSP